MMQLGTPKEQRPYAGLRVLVVEDEALVAMLLEDMLADLGCTVVGPASRIPAALDLVAEGNFDVVILDLNLAGDEVYPVAEALERRNIPYVIATGYGTEGVREPFRSRPMLRKPFRRTDLEQALGTMKVGG